MFALLSPLAGLVGIEASALKGRLIRQAALWGLLALCGAIALVAVIVAINTALGFVVGPVVAPLIIAGAALLLGLIAYGVFAMLARAEARRQAEKQRGTEMAALMATAAITALPVVAPALRKFGLPAGTAAIAIYSLLNARSARRGSD